jgi:uncharacterized protein (DUF302 family)
MKTTLILMTILFFAQTPKARAVPTKQDLTSVYDFHRTLELVKNEIKKADLGLAAEIDHSKAAESVDLKLPKTMLLLVGNPKIGTQIMARNQLTALELPMKILVWESPEGTVVVSYRSPIQALESYQLSDLEQLLKKMEATLSGIVLAATK